MYIRRKSYSAVIDEHGEKKLFSTTEIMNEESYLEKIYSENPEQKEFNSKAAKKLNKVYIDMMRGGKIKKIPSKNVNYSIEDKQLQLSAFNRNSPYTELRKEGKKKYLSDYDHDNREHKLLMNKNIMKYWRD